MKISSDQSNAGGTDLNMDHAFVPKTSSNYTVHPGHSRLFWVELRFQSEPCSNALHSPVWLKSPPNSHVASDPDFWRWKIECRFRFQWNFSLPLWAISHCSLDIQAHGESDQHLCSMPIKTRLWTRMSNGWLWREITGFSNPSSSILHHRQALVQRGGWIHGCHWPVHLNRLYVYVRSTYCQLRLFHVNIMILIMHTHMTFQGCHGSIWKPVTCQRASKITDKRTTLRLFPR